MKLETKLKRERELAKIRANGGWLPDEFGGWYVLDGRVAVVEERGSQLVTFLIEWDEYFRKFGEQLEYR